MHGTTGKRCSCIFPMVGIWHCIVKVAARNSTHKNEPDRTSYLELNQCKDTCHIPVSVKSLDSLLSNDMHNLQQCMIQQEQTSTLIFMGLILKHWGVVRDSGVYLSQGVN